MPRFGRAWPVASAKTQKPAKTVVSKRKTVQTNNIDVAMTNSSAMR